MVDRPMPMLPMLEPPTSSNNSSILHSTLDLQRPKPLMPERLLMSDFNEDSTLISLGHPSLLETHMATCPRRARGRQCRANICHRNIKRLCRPLFVTQLDLSVERFMRGQLTIENGKTLSTSSKSSAKIAI